MVYGGTPASSREWAVGARRVDFCDKVVSSVLDAT